MIGDWLDIGPVADIPLRGARTVPVAGGEEIAIFRTGDDRVYALVNRCPHKRRSAEPGHRPRRRGRLPAAQLADLARNRRGAGRGQGLRADHPGQGRRRPRPDLAPAVVATASRLSVTRRSAPPAPIAASAAASSRRRRADGSVDDRRRSRSSRQSRPPLLQGHASRRDGRPRRAAAPPDDRQAPRELGQGARSRRPTLPRDDRAAMGRTASPSTSPGQLLTEDYYVANKLMKGFIGSANIDTNSRLCMSSAVAGHLRAFGEDVVPASYDDLDAADLIVLVGSNTAWCHPIVYQRIQAARAARGTKLVVIDPRRTETCRGRRPPPRAPARQRRRADERPARPLPRARAWSTRRILEAHVAVPDGLLGAARRRQRPLVGRARPATLPPAELQRFYELFAATPADRHAVQPGHQPVAARHRSGQRDHQPAPRHRPHRQARRRALLDHRPAQRDGRARGRRARLDARRAYGFRARKRRARRPLLGRAANGDQAGAEGGRPVPRASATAGSRRCGSWRPIPAVSHARCRHASARRSADCPFVVVSDVIAETDTSALRACPAAGRRLGREGRHGHQLRALRSAASARFLPLPGEAKPDWWIVSAGRAGGWAGATAFAYDGPADIWREHARLSAYQNDGTRLFDLAGQAAIGNDDLRCAWRRSAGAERPSPTGAFRRRTARARLVPVRAGAGCRAARANGR